MKPKSTLRLFLLGYSLLATSTAYAADGTWLGAAGAWNVAGTWSGGTIADGTDFTANFTGVNIVADQTVTLGVNRTIGNITFTDDTTPSNNLTISGNTLTLDVTSGVPIIDVTQSGRTLTIGSVINGSDGLQKNGSGTLTLSSTVSTGLTAASGTTNITSGSGLFTGAVTVNSGATLNTPINGNYSASSTTVDAGANYSFSGGFGTNTTLVNPMTINGTVTKPNNGALTIGSGGALSGSGSISFGGQCTITINSNNSSFAGTMTEASQGGSGFIIGNNGALGSGTFVIGNNNNVIQTSIAGPGFVNSNTTAIRIDASRTIGNGNNMNFGTGAVTLNSSPTMTISSPLITFGGAIGETGGTRSFTKAGTGTLVFGGSTSNTFTGLTSVTAGVLQLNKSGTSNAIGAGGLSVGTGATVTYTGASTDMIANTAPVTIAGTGLLNLNGVSDTIGALNLTAVAGNNALVTTGAGTLTLGGNVTFTAATTGTAQITGNLDLGAATRTFNIGAGTGLGQDVLIGAIISGSGVGITKTGTGRLTLTGSNTYNGLTTVSAGSLIVLNGDPFAGGGGVTVNTGTFTYAPTAAGALNLGSNILSLANGSAIGTALGGTAGQSAITSSATASLAGTGVVNVRAIPGVAFTTGTNNLITAASGLNGGTYTLGTVYNNTDFTLSNFTRTATAISVDVNSATALSGNVFWKGGLSGSTGVWSASNGTTQSNWQVTDGVNQPLAPSATADLVFSTATAPGTMAGMTLGANMTVRTITINNIATAFGLSADGNTLTITPSSSSTGITIGAGVQASSINAPVTLGAAQTWTNNSANTLTIGNAISQNGNSLTFAGTGSFSLDTATTTISGAGGIIKNGTGQLIVNSGQNQTFTFTGDIVLNGGSIGSQNAGSFYAGKNTKITEGYLGARFGSNHAWTGGLGTGVNQIQITGGTSGFSGEGNTGSSFTIGTAGSTLVWGALGEGTATGFFNPTILLANGTHRMNANGKGTLANGIDLNGITRTITSTQTTDNAATSGFTISGVISNSSGTASGLTKTGVGNLILSGANTFNGTTTLSAGYITLGNALALQNSVLDTTASIAGSGTAGLRATVTTLTLGGLSGNKNFAAAGGVFTTATGGYASVTALTLNPGTGVTPSYDGVIANGAVGMTLAKTGAGTQTLTNSNTYSGTTTITGGTLASTNAVQGFGTNLSVSVGGSGTLRLVNDSTVPFTNGTSAYNIANSASGATINVDRATGTGTNTITVGNLTTTSTAVTWQLNFTGANGVGLNAGTVTTPTAAAGSHTISNNIADGGSLTLAGVTGGGTGAAATLIFNGAATTTVAGAITQTATAQALTKNGAGTLFLNGTNTYTGLTSVNAGTLGGTGTIAGAVTVAAAGNVAPGASVGTLNINNNLTVSAMAGGSGVMTYELGPIVSSDKIAITGTLDIGAGVLGFNNFAFSNAGGLQNGTYKLITSGAAVTGTLDGANLTGSVGAGTGTLQITGNDLELVVAGIGAGTPYDTWATSKGLTGANNAKTDDPDNDGRNNLAEFAFNGDPLSGSDNGKVYVLSEDSNFDGDAIKELILTVAVRTGTLAFSGSPSPSANQASDDITYSIEGSLDLASFPTTVNVVAPVTTGLPPSPGAGYEYRSFSLNGSNGLSGKGFLRAKVTSP